MRHAATFELHNALVAWVKQTPYDITMIIARTWADRQHA